MQFRMGLTKTLATVGVLMGLSGFVSTSALAQSKPPADAGETRQAPKADESSRERVQIVGSSSMHEALTPAVVRVFTDSYKAEAPEVRSTGTSAGIKEFCAGIGAKHPDIVAASRKMRKSEFEKCQENGALDIIEVKIGALPVMVMTKKGTPVFDLTPRMVYLAAAKYLPDEGNFEKNDHKKWRELGEQAPDKKIKIIIPNEESGSRGFFDDRFLEGGCRHYKSIDNIYSADARVERCTTLRDDGVIVEIPEPYGDAMAEEIAKTRENTVAVAIAGELTYLAHQDNLTLLTVHGFLPTRENVLADNYQLVAFPRYYFKRAHMRNNRGKGVVRGLRELIRIISSEEMVGPGGVFDNLGLIPLEDEEREDAREEATGLKSFEP